ncbi:MAG TPA: pyridoxamine 5'-phosphate oxidase family protein [Caulobacteraceae bacterium]|nr:pyridoxamine 5'-phosphate oxidase family protein [Caulobacteraceae bacterium]
MSDHLARAKLFGIFMPPSSASDVAFSPAVKAVQLRKGSRQMLADADASAEGAWPTRIREDLAEFIASMTSVYFATASSDGQPHVQHRGGPAGFLKVLDDETIAWADFAGNRQYVSIGNLSENPKACLFLMDYATRQRVKLFGEARVVEDDPELLKQLTPQGYRARPEQAVVFKVKAWNANCSQHIPQRFELADVVRVIAEKDRRIAELEAELEALTAGA